MRRPLDQNMNAASEVIGTVLMVGVCLALSAVLVLWALSFTGQLPENPLAGKEASDGGSDGGSDGPAMTFVVYINDDNYVIELVHIRGDPYYPIEQMTFSLLDNVSSPIVTDDGHGGELRFGSVPLDIINWNSDKYDSAVDDEDLFTYGGIFYEQHDGDNFTAYIVFKDVNADGRIQDGDRFYVRETSNGGVCGHNDDSIFQMERRGKGIVGSQPLH